MLKHVIVPLDGSELAQVALDHALNLLKAGGHITLVTVLPSPQYPLSDFYPPTGSGQTNEVETRFKELMTHTRNHLNQIAEDILLEHSFEVTTEVEIGEPAAMIADLAERRHADAIVMSTHGRSGIGRWLFGSVTQKVLEANVCPVYVIPAKMREKVDSPAALKVLPA